MCLGPAHTDRLHSFAWALRCSIWASWWAPEPSAGLGSRFTRHLFQDPRGRALVAFSRHNHTLSFPCLCSPRVFSSAQPTVWDSACARFLAKGHWQVARKVNSQIVDQVAPEPGFSTPALLCLCPQSLTLLKLN